MTRSSQTMITGSSRVVFILGRPLEHSLSPVMQNAAFQKAGLSWVYSPLEVSSDQLSPTLGMMRAVNVKGANVTVPYKELVLPYLDGVEPEARWLGSVNTLYRKGNKLLGTSTDGEGFLRSLGAFRKKLKGSRGLILGAGGAAKAVAGALARSGVSGFYVANRSNGRAVRLVKSIRQRYPRLELAALSVRESEKFLSRCDWVVQATSVGLKKGDPCPLSLGALKPPAFVVDLIYHHETNFLKEARRRRLRRLNGIGMLLHQGALSYERWTGKTAPLEVMRRVLLERLSFKRGWE
jgi:shikimate dehydrogenase